MNIPVRCYTEITDTMQLNELEIGGQEGRRFITNEGGKQYIVEIINKGENNDAI